MQLDQNYSTDRNNDPENMVLTRTPQANKSAMTVEFESDPNDTGETFWGN